MAGGAGWWSTRRLSTAKRWGRRTGAVVRGELGNDLGEPSLVLERGGASVACDVLEGIVKTDERERASIFSATAM